MPHLHTKKLGLQINKQMLHLPSFAPDILISFCNFATLFVGSKFALANLPRLRLLLVCQEHPAIRELRLLQEFPQIQVHREVQHLPLGLRPRFDLGFL